MTAGLCSAAVTLFAVVNIIPAKEASKKPTGLEGLTQPAEVRLVDAFNEVSKRSGELIKSREYEKYFAEMRKLKAPVDRFFDKVRVLDPDNARLKSQRVELLMRIADLFYEIADFTKITIDQVGKY